MSKSTVRIPPVEFSRGVADDDDGRVVRRRGVIFRAGDYNHQQFKMSPAELRALAASFKGEIPLDHGHPSVDGPIDFGRLVGISASPDGTTLYGEVEAPSWLDQAMADAKWRVSASFDRNTKAIRRLSLVTRPQISDAELQAAFACACGGHEAEVQTPAKEKSPMDEWREDVLAAMEGMDDDERSAVIAALKAAPDDFEIPDDDDDEGDTPDAGPDAGPSNFAAYDDPEKAELRARLGALEAERRREKAVHFAEAEVQAGRILPHEKATAADIMFQALDDDAIDGAMVNFSVGGKPTRGTREAMVRAVYGQRQPHKWNQNLVPSTSADFGRVLDNAGDAPESDQDYAKRLVAKYNGRNKKAGA